MRPRNENISGLNYPTQAQAVQLAMAWERETSADRLRRRQVIMTCVAVILGVLRAVGGTPAAGIGTALVALVLFSPLMLIWKGQIRKIRKRAGLLRDGCFRLAPVDCLTARPDRWNRHYVGAAAVRLQDGTNIKRAQMPYYLAKRLWREHKTISAWLVQIEGDPFPIIFAR